MSAPDPSTGPHKYYDPGEVEAYIKDATSTITALQSRIEELTRRAASAEQALGEYQPETASLGRALLLAGEVADKTIADADARAEEILHEAAERAKQIVEAAEAEAVRHSEAARRDATQAFESGKSRLLAAVNAFVEGSSVLRAELARVEDDAMSRHSVTQPSYVGAPPRRTSIFGPAGATDPWLLPPEARLHPSGRDAPDRFPSPTLNGASRETSPSSLVDAERQIAADPPDSVTSFSPPQPRVAAPDDRRNGSA